MIITSDHKGSSFIPQLKAADIPYVFIGRPSEADGIHYVDTDNLHGGYLATSHLIELGNRRIATIASGQNTSGDDRVEGYRQALRAHALPWNENLVAYGDYSLESGYMAMRALIPEVPKAVYVASDMMALGALRALREAGLRVPEDVAVVSHDDLPPAVQADPTITTIHQPIGTTGETAVEKLAQIISSNGDLPTQQIVLPVELVVRASCGALHLT